MFNSLTGTITGKMPNALYLETHGIEWDICVPDSTLNALPPVGQTGKVFTWLLHREDQMKLFGFATARERSLFFDLLKVDGIGAKGAVKILSNISESQLLSALDDGNLTVLQKIPGIGKKTAGKMLLALKGRLSLEEDSSVIRVSKNNAFADVIESLVNMGYERRDCEQTVHEIADSLATDADFNEKGREGKEEILFRRALVDLAR